MDIQHAPRPEEPRAGRAPPPSQRLPITQEEIARALGGEILGGVHPPGELMPPEAALLKRFGVSRTVLREVIKTLAAKGLLSSRARVGTWVLDPGCWNFFDPDVLAWKADYGPDPEFQRQLTELRQVIEPAGARMAAARRDAAQMAELRRCLGALQDAGPSRQMRSDATVAFQRQLANASGNALMISLSMLLCSALTHRLAPGPRGLCLHQREALVKAVEAGDGDLAARLALELIG